MALGAIKRFITWIAGGQQTTSASASSEWMTVIDAGGMDAQDGTAGAITNVDTGITASDHHIFQREGRGTWIMARMKYAGTPNADPSIQCFGRHGSYAGTTGGWHRLRNNANSETAALVTATSADVTDGTYKWTSPNNSTNVWDVAGCDEFLFGITVAYGVSAGSAATATLEVKFL